MDDAHVLHADLDAFYASVEQRDNPELRAKAVIVGEGVVLAASYEARANGVRSAMPGGEARRRCPHAIVVPARFSAYAEASREVFEIFRSVTPLVEPLSVDEAFLDVSGARRLLGEPTAIGESLRRSVREEVGLPLSVGIARTKFLAKVASSQAKPDGLLRVDPERELAFLHPLPVQALWGVGPATRDRLARRGIHTVGDLAEVPESVLAGMLGGAVGRHLRALAWNRDPRDVQPGRRDRSIGSQRALGRRKRDLDECREIVLGIADRVAARVRRADLAARTVTLSVRFADMQRITRSRTFDVPIDATETISSTAVELAVALLGAPVEDADLRESNDQYGRRVERPTVLAHRGVSLLGVRLTGLLPRGPEQLGLPLDGRATSTRRDLDERIDQLRDRFGRDAVTRLSLLDTGGGLEVLARPTAVDAEHET